MSMYKGKVAADVNHQHGPGGNLYVVFLLRFDTGFSRLMLIGGLLPFVVDSKLL
jgi:hypothetical protein